MTETNKKPIFPRYRRRRISQICNTSNIEKETENLFKLWILRVLVDLNIVNEVIDKDNYITEWSIADFLGIEVDPNNPEITRKQAKLIFQKQLSYLEKKKTFEQPEKLSKNVQIISDLIGLSLEEKQILTFVILLNQNQILQDVTHLLGGELNSNQVKNILSVILRIPYEVVNDCFSSQSKLTKSSLVTINKKTTSNLLYKFDFIGDSFADNMLSSSEDIDYLIKEYVSRCNQGELTLKDFDYLNDDLSTLIPYLSKSIKKNKQGVNVLLYGFPGTGKTELVKSVATKLNIPLYEIAYSDLEGEPIEGVRRLRAYKIAQALLLSKKPLLMFDETEDVFNSGNALLSKRQSNKAWINRILETNTVPTIWITNNIYSVNPAIIRRFDMVIELDIPSQSKRKQIIEKSAHKFLSPESVQMLAANNNIAPAVISRTAEVISFIGTKQPQKSFETIVNQTLKAQGFSELNSMSATKLPGSYNVNYLNVDRDLNALVSGIQRNGNARLCLYGPPGTGKSAFAKYISDKLDKPLLIKKGSDLLSKWVGEAEKNIARAFREATTEKAVLLFDEVDGFIADRKFAQNSWEITQVNEMLVQLENFSGIFIATTNLMDNLDQASLRRFDLKLKMDYLLPEQSWLLFQEECSLIDTRFSNTDRDEILRLRNLTPGDFATVRRQHAFHPIESSKEFVLRLKEEIKVKQVGNSQLIGFVK